MDNKNQMEELINNKMWLNLEERRGERAKFRETAYELSDKIIDLMVESGLSRSRMLEVLDTTRTEICKLF